MTEQETLKVMATLSAFYGKPKADEMMMARAWHVTLRDYDYAYAMMAVHVFARKDTREYGSFPTLGCLIEAIEEVKKVPHKIFYHLRQKTEYKDLEPEERWLIPEYAYNKAKAKDNEQLLDEHEVIINYIKDNAHKQYLLKGETE